MKDNVIRHVLMNQHENKTKTWCGRTLKVAEWAFTDAQHAAMNGKKKGRLLVCKKCSKKIYKSLMNGRS